MRIKAILRKYAGFIIFAPAIVPLYLAFDILYWYVPSYYHFIRQDSRLDVVHQCMPHPLGGGLVRQDEIGTKYYRPGNGIPCVCNSLSGCVPVSLIMQQYAWHFIQATIFIAAVGVLGFVFFRARRMVARKTAFA